MIRILHRPAEVVEGGWQPVGEASTLDDIRDEIDSWQGPRLGHGDLVVVGTKVPTLLVFDGARGSLIEVGDAPKTGWVSYWEGKKANAASLLKICGAVDRRRIVLAACAVAEISLKYVPAREDRPRLAIEAARRWARGNATVGEVRAAADAAYAAARNYADSAAYYAARAAASAAYYAARAAAADDADDAAYSARAADAAARNASAASAAYAASVYSARAADASDAAYSDAAYAAAAAYSDADAADYAKAVRRYIPLSVLACSIVEARDPLPMPRENPRRGRKR